MSSNQMEKRNMKLLVMPTKLGVSMVGFMFQIFFLCFMFSYGPVVFYGIT